MVVSRMEHCNVVIGGLITGQFASGLHNYTVLILEIRGLEWYLPYCRKGLNMIIDDSAKSGTYFTDFLTDLTWLTHSLKRFFCCSVEGYCKRESSPSAASSLEIIMMFLMPGTSQICGLHCAATHAPALTKHEPPLAVCTTLSWLHPLHLHDPIATPSFNIPFVLQIIAFHCTLPPTFLQVEESCTILIIMLLATLLKCT